MRKLNFLGSYDVVVCGGGPAGISAAFSAAEEGAKVLLLEQHGFLGGMATSGLPLLSFHDLNGNQVVGGFPKYLVEKLVEKGGSPGHIKIKAAHFSTFTPVDAEIIKLGIFDTGTTSELLKADIVFCSDVIEHIFCPEDAVNCLRHFIKKNGKLILIVPNGRLDTEPARSILDDGYSYQGHVNFWSPESWDYFIKKQFPGNLVHTGIFYKFKLFAIIQF